MSSIAVFFSQSGNTRKLAEMIGAATGCAVAEINASGSCDADLGGYDTVFIGTPNWAATAPDPVKKYVSSVSLAGKKVAVFCTHGMGGMQNVADDIIKLCTGAEIIGSFAHKGAEIDSVGDKLNAWLKEIGVI